MRFYCEGCRSTWTTLDADEKGSCLPRSCPACMKKMGFRWLNVTRLEFEELQEGA